MADENNCPSQDSKMSATGLAYHSRVAPHRKGRLFRELGPQSISGPFFQCGLMSGEQFYINYSLNGEHYAMGPYHTRHFAMSHIDDIRRQPGASNVYLGNKPPDDKSYRKLVPITMAMKLR